LQHEAAQALLRAGFEDSRTRTMTVRWARSSAPHLRTPPPPRFGIHDLPCSSIRDARKLFAPFDHRRTGGWLVRCVLLQRATRSLCDQTQDAEVHVGHVTAGEDGSSGVMEPNPLSSLNALRAAAAVAGGGVG
jgi:hypothetical protein